MAKKPRRINDKVSDRVYKKNRFVSVSFGGVGTSIACCRNNVDPKQAMIIPTTSITWSCSFKKITENIQFNITVIELLLAKNI